MLPTQPVFRGVMIDLRPIALRAGILRKLRMTVMGVEGVEGAWWSGSLREDIRGRVKHGPTRITAPLVLPYDAWLWAKNDRWDGEPGSTRRLTPTKSFDLRRFRRRGGGR